MPNGSSRRAFFSTLAAVLALAASAPAALALDAYWHGRRGPVWEHGIDSRRGLSNWYRKPPLQGKKSQVPDGGAVFAAGALETKIWISEPGTNIAAMLILRDAPRYDFEVRSDASLDLQSPGLVNQSPVPPRFFIRPKALMALRREARLRGRNDFTSAIIEIDDDGLLIFDGRSGGGNARVTNGGTVVFYKTSSAETMRFDFPQVTTALQFPRITFRDGATGGDAQFTIRRSADVSFEQSSGPGGNHRVSAGSVQNFGGELRLGSNTLTLRKDYLHGPGLPGSIHVNIKGVRAGNIYVKGKATLGGDLFINPAGASPVPPGAYRVFYAEGGRTGAFNLVTSIGSSELRYFENEVFFIVHP